MTAKPETLYIGRVHKALVNVYHEKNHNAYRGGTPDVWYSGDLGDLWVEYKYIAKLPVRSVILPDLSGLQTRWLGNRYDEGRRVAVIVGSPRGGRIYQAREWLEPLTPEEFCRDLLSPKEIAAWITKKVGASKCHSTT